MPSRAGSGPNGLDDVQRRRESGIGGVPCDDPAGVDTQRGRVADDGLAGQAPAMNRRRSQGMTAVGFPSRPGRQAEDEVLEQVV